MSAVSHDLRDAAAERPAARPRRSAKDKVVIVALSVVLAALIGGVVWGVWYVSSALIAQSQARLEASSYPVPATPDELRAAQLESESSQAVRPVTLTGLFTARVACADEAASSSSARAVSTDGAVSRGDASASESAGVPGESSTVSDPAGNPAENVVTAADGTPMASEDELVDNPIDFKELQKVNTDIYAWIYVPGTGINLPVLQNPFDDFYYLSHNVKREEYVYGSIYTQMANEKDFSDPVTVVYGHDGEAEFRNLHYFEDEKFFAENEYFYVYTVGHIYTYRVLSAYKTDNRHILNSYDFSKSEVLEQYFKTVLEPDSLLVNVCEGAVLDATKDKIVQLSTCMPEEFYGPSRYIVTGVLVDDQLTR